MLINLDEDVIDIIKLIKNQGYKAYVVGGYVRDALLFKENVDIDIATNATPEKLKEILKNYKIEENFINMGSVKFNYNKYHFEITTFRKEYDYINYRRTNRIEFTNSLEEDLIRRDFTINALCSDGNDIIDLFEGIKDLSNKIIRTIGNPFIRLKEDALRILRAMRFSSKLGFSVEDNLKCAIINNYKYLSYINFDIKYRELKEILSGNYYINVLKDYQKELEEIYSCKLKLQFFSGELSYEEKEALFFYFSDNKINNKYLKNKELNFSKDRIDLKKKLFKYGCENIYNLLYFRSKVLNDNIDEFHMVREIIENKECYNLKMLDINGKDLLHIEVEKNKIGKHLNYLLEAVIEGKCKNNKKELLKYLYDNILD